MAPLMLVLVDEGVELKTAGKAPEHDIIQLIRFCLEVEVSGEQTRARCVLLALSSSNKGASVQYP
jgi:hypothetical protein